MHAAELQLREKVASDPIHAIKLRLVAAVGAGVRVLLEPESFASAADRLLTILALEGILQYIVANAANQLWEECFDLADVDNLLLFVGIFLVTVAFINDCFHRK